MNKPVKLSDIIDAIEMMTDEYSSYLNMILLIVYEYKSEALKQITIDWCKENSVEYVQ
jgi:hypothetical protein